MARSQSSSTAGNSSDDRTDLRLLVCLLTGAVVVACIINIRYGRYFMAADDLIREKYRIKAETPIRPWRTIVLHHSGTDWGNAERFDRYHLNVKHMENGLAYHFVIGNGSDSGDGKIEVGRRWVDQLQGGHCDRDEINELGIGICLVGDFTKTSPTPAQLDSLIKLLRELQADFDIPTDRIFGHTEINRKPTVCPGPRFPLDAIRSQLRAGAKVADASR